MNERKLAIGSTVLLFLASVAILTYQQGVISDLTAKVHNLKIREHAAGKGPVSFSERTVEAAPGTYELDVIKAAMAVPDFGSMIPPELSRGLKWTLRDRNRLHFIGGNLVILEVQDPTGHVLPLLFQIPDPSQAPTWRYLFGFVSS